MMKTRRFDLKNWKITYNSPVILTYALICLAVVGLGYVSGGWTTREFFVLMPNFSLANLPRMFTYVLGHGNFAHFFGNFAIILLVGPLIEEKYGAKNLLMMIAFTAFVTAIIQILLFNSALVGASGIAFLLILLSPFTNYKERSIPLTFVFILIMYLGREVFDMIAVRDNVSQFAHVLGGLIGAGFGMFLKPVRR